MALSPEHNPDEVFLHDRLEELAAQLSVPGVDREHQRQLLTPDPTYAETRAILKLARANPNAWNHLVRFIGKVSLEYATRNGEISYYEKAPEAFGRIMWNGGAAKAVVLLAKSLIPEELEKRLDKLAKKDENRKVEHNVESERDARWIPAVG